jgi:hypothetical protein
MAKKTISSAVAEKLGWYVYLYVNPEDGKVFYVGKGKGPRVLAHLNDRSESCKTAQIRALLAKGQEPRIDLLAHGLQSEEMAACLESAVIDVLGLHCLTNAIRGLGSRHFGRMTLDQAITHYTAEEAVIDDPCLLIRINRLYRFDMTEEDYWRAGSSSRP